MAPVDYLASSYYERWLDRNVRLLVEKGVITREELERRMAQLAGGTDPAPPHRDPKLARSHASRDEGAHPLPPAGAAAALRAGRSRPHAERRAGRAHAAAPLRARQARRHRPRARHRSSSRTRTPTGRASSPTRSTACASTPPICGARRPSRAHPFISISGSATSSPRDRARQEHVMSDAHDEHGHHHREPESVLSLRVRALESLLVEKKLVVERGRRPHRRARTSRTSARTTAPRSSRGPGSTRRTSSGSSPTARRPSRSWASAASTSRSSRTGPASTTSSSARSARAIRTRSSACRRSGTSRSSTARARCASRASCCASSASICPRAWRSASGTRAPSCGIWCCPSGPPAPRA